MIDIFLERGIALEKQGMRIVLDPKRSMEYGVVSHGHMDHLVEGALMTPETRDIMRARRGWEKASLLEIGQRKEWFGFDVMFHSAGHVLGSAMVETEGILYTGDFNPEGSFMSPPPPRPDVDALIMEATYGGRGFVFPPKSQVLSDLVGWLDALSSEGPLLLGAYEFGKAQEVMNLGKRLGMRVVVPEDIGRITEVYNTHGASLEFDILGEEMPVEPGTLIVVPPSWLKKPRQGPGDRYESVKMLRKKGGRTAFVSGWCAVYKYFRSMLIDAQFPLSDHADHEHLVSFVQDVSPRDVYLVHTNKKIGTSFANELTERTGCRAKPLEKS